MKIRGMTLIEVMVALAIFAMAGTAVMKAASEHLRSVSMIEEITFATWVANNQLTQLHLRNKWPLKNNEKGSEEMAGRTWYWQQKVLETNDANLKSVEMIVKLNEDDEQGITSVTSFFAKPDQDNK